MANGSQPPGPITQLQLFEALPQHVAPSSARRRGRGTQRSSASKALSQPPTTRLTEPTQFEWPFPRAREAAGKFVKEALHDGAKEAAKKVVVGLIFAGGATAVGHFQFDSFGWKERRESKAVIQPWETTVTPETHPTVPTRR